MKSDKKNKHNNPYYMNTEGKTEIKPPEHEEKFKLGIDKNNNPVITIDNTIHFMNKRQFHAFTCGIFNINKKISPEVI